MSSFLDLKTFSSALGGDGIECDRKILKGQTVLTEKPLFCMQTLSNKRNALVCGYCLKFIGSTDLQLNVLARKITRIDVVDSCAKQNALDGKPEIDKLINSKYGNFLSDVIPCSKNCGELYCSIECRNQHWKHTHNLTCTGDITDEESSSHPLIQFKTHAATTNEIFLMVADVFASITNEIIDYQQKHQVLDTVERSSGVYSLLQTYVRELWWDAAIAPPGTNASQLKRSLRTLNGASYRHLVKAYYPVLKDIMLKQSTAAMDANSNNGASDEIIGIDKILTSEYMSRTIGMFEQNNVGLRLENPLVAYLKDLLHKAKQHVGPMEAPVDLTLEFRYLCSLMQTIVNHIDNEGEDDCDDEYCMEVSGSDGPIAVDGADDMEMEDDEGEEEISFEESSLESMVRQIERWVYLYGDEEPEEAEGVEVMEVGASSSKTASSVIGATADVLELNVAGLEAIFPPLDGTSFYKTICKINHSCKPNVRVQYSSFQHSNNPIYGGLIATMVALEDINPHDELVQSYIDQYLPYAERKVALADYGFLCRCEKCRRECKLK